MSRHAIVDQGQTVYKDVDYVELTHQQVLIAFENKKQEYIDAVQMELDTYAQLKGYDNIISLCSYSTSDHVKFGTEGRDGIIKRDLCWDYCYKVLRDIEENIRPEPTITELIEELP